MPFYQTDLLIVVADPHRVGHEETYYPGETNLRMADVAVINKIDSAKPENVEKLKQIIGHINPSASIINAQGYMGKRVWIESNVGIAPTLNTKYVRNTLKRNVVY